MAVNIIELSGADYSGKSTHAEMLTYFTLKNIHNYGGYNNYGNAFPSGMNPGEFWTWWFEESSTEELGTAIVKAYNTRQSIAERSNYDVGVVERGETMVRAQLVANFATRREVDFHDCIEEVDSIVTSKILKPATGTHKSEFNLEMDKQWFDKMPERGKYVRNPANFDNNFSKYQNDFYSKYLSTLRQTISYYGEQSSAQKILIDRPAVDIQNIIRKHDLISELKLPVILEQNPLVVGIAGLSESGKGTVAEEMARRYGFTRLKLGYFNETSRISTGDMYGNPNTIAMNALRFIANNRHLKRITFESLYGPHLAMEFMSLLGKDRWKAIMLEVPEDIRKKRLVNQYPDLDANEVILDQRIKDDQKLSQGILEYENIADFNIDNSGTIDETLDKIAKGLNL